MNLKLDRVSYRYRSRNGFELSEISWTLDGARTLALLGPNGAGKSTLLRVVSGLELPSQGRVLIDGVPLSSMKAAERAARVAFMPSRFVPPFPLSVRELVESAGYCVAPGVDTDAFLRRFQKEALSDRNCQTLSSGELQAVLLLRAVAQGSPLIVLDEPTAHLDPKAKSEFWRLVDRIRAEENRMIILATQEFAKLRAFATDALLLDRGRMVAFADPSELLNGPQPEAVFGVKLEL